MKQPISYWKQYVTTQKYRWIVSIPPYALSVLPLLPAVYLGKRPIFFTSFTHWENDLYYDLNPAVRAAWRSFLSRSDVVTVTEAARQSLISAFGVDSTVIPHCCDPTAFESRPQEQTDDDIVLFVGRLVEQKGIELLLTLSERNPDIEFWFAGDGDYEAELERRSRTQDNVEFLGFLDNTDALVNAYNRASLKVLPSLKRARWREFFGIVLIEALACETPVVASDHPGPSSIITNDVGRVISEGDINGFEAAIRELLDNDKKRAAMGTAGRQHVLNNYSVDVVSDQWRDVL
ncbi:hypothetical protein GCM10009000_107620 [Halobacterium noricense]